LGLFDFVLLDEAKVELLPGTTMLLVTDGVTEAMNSNREQFGTERIDQLLARDGKQDAQVLCNEFLDSINTFRGDAPVHDDITLVAIHAT
jgi:sigma-B regulation protein RsbU (phosphoserine phosphatase)